MGRTTEKPEGETDLAPLVASLQDQLSASLAEQTQLQATIGQLTEERDSLQAMLTKAHAEVEDLGQQIETLKAAQAQLLADQPAPAETVPPKWWISSVPVQTPEQGYIAANTPFLSAAPRGKTWEEHPGLSLEA